MLGGDGVISGAISLLRGGSDALLLLGPNTVTGSITVNTAAATVNLFGGAFAGSGTNQVTCTLLVATSLLLSGTWVARAPLVISGSDATSVINLAVDAQVSTQFNLTGGQFTGSVTASAVGSKVDLFNTVQLDGASPLELYFWNVR